MCGDCIAADECSANTSGHWANFSICDGYLASMHNGKLAAMPSTKAGSPYKAPVVHLLVHVILLLQVVFDTTIRIHLSFGRQQRRRDIFYLIRNNRILLKVLLLIK